MALCRTDLVEKQKALIEARAKHKTLLETMEKQTQQLQEAHDANARMEGRVKNVAKRLKYKGNHPNWLKLGVQQFYVLRTFLIHNIVKTVITKI